jgi:hypothetical protein
VRYNPSAVEIYNTSSSLARFENKNIFFYYKNALACHNVGVADVNSEFAGFFRTENTSHRKRFSSSATLLPTEK